MSNTNKSSSITSDNPEAQKREQQIFLRKFNDDFVKYKNILKLQKKYIKNNIIILNRGNTDYIRVRV